MSNVVWKNYILFVDFTGATDFWESEMYTEFMPGKWQVVPFYSLQVSPKLGS